MDLEERFMDKEIPKNPLSFGIYVSKPHKRWAIAAFIFVLIGTFLDRLWVIIFKNLTDAISTSPIAFDRVWLWAILLPILFIVSETIWRGSGFTGMRWFMAARSTAYEKLYQYLSMHSKDYFNSRFAGSLTNKIANAVDGIDGLFEKILWRFTPLSIGLILYAIIAGLNNLLLGAIIVVWSVVYIAVNIWFAKKLKLISYGFSKSISALKGRVVDSITNISLVHENAYLSGEQKYIKGYIDRQYDAGFKSWYLSEWVLVANGFMIFIFILAMIVSVIYLFQNKLISLGVVVMVVTIVGDLSSRLFFIGQELRDASKIYGQIDEGLEEILKEHVITDVLNASDLKVKEGNISIEKIDFEYEKVGVFKDFSLNIPAGQKVGFVGKSGAGKTTLVSLLLRHFDIQKGTIKIDGQNIKDVTLESLRQAIAFVPQDTTLFHRTVCENIAYSNPEASDREIQNAAKSAQAHDFIMQLPKGYATLVGERGIKLSGGQRQRIAIARAFLKNAPILILDEATSSLDTESEQAIQLSLKKLMRKGTVIAIAHRLSTLKEMDKIVVVDDGKIAEYGSPRELLDKKDGIFRGMWEHQIQGFIVDE